LPVANEVRENCLHTPTPSKRRKQASGLLS